MNEPQRFCMQGLSRQELKTILNELFVFREHRSFYNLVSSVHGVIEQRVTKVLHMSPDLMSSSRFKSALHQRDIPEIFQKAIMCDRVATVISVGKCCGHSPVF